MNPQRQQGIALITAILVVAIATIAATAMVVSANVAIHRATTLQESEKAWWYAEGAEQWILTVLQRDREDNEVDSLDEPWAQPIDYLPVDEGALRGRIVDLQGRFNVNNLGIPDAQQYPRYRQQFERLFSLVEAGDAFQSAAVADAIRDWIDEDQEPTGFDGAEDGVYLGLQPPYRAANRPISSVSELLAIRGVTADMYRALLPHIAALPAWGTPINVNTATEPVLLSLLEAPTPEMARFIDEREERPLQEPGELGALIPAGTPPVSINTQYFRLESEALIGSSRVGLYHLILRSGQGAPIVLARSADGD